MDLSSLIPMLKENGVTRFEGYGVKVELGHHFPVVQQSQAFTPSGAELKPNPPGVPDPTMDLPGTNDAMSADAILNWSAPPSVDVPSVALTGDAPLAGE